MINLIVWSKDRACQLDALLRSIEKYAPGIFDPYIVYIASSKEYGMAYGQLQNEMMEKDQYCLLVDEKNFYSDTMMGLEFNENPYCAFCTDDTLLFRDCSTFKPSMLDDIPIFSFRYGLNTIVQDYHTGRKQPPLRNFKDEGDTIVWKWSDYIPTDNYGYPFGLDLHVYRSDLIIKTLGNTQFNTSNQLETILFHRRLQAPQLIRSFRYSAAVNVPVNNISGVTRSGETYSYTIEELNQQFLDGRRINIDKIVPTTIVGSHQELPLELE